MSNNTSLPPFIPGGTSGPNSNTQFPSIAAPQVVHLPGSGGGTFRPDSPTSVADLLTPPPDFRQVGGGGPRNSNRGWGETFRGWDARWRSMSPINNLRAQLEVVLPSIVASQRKIAQIIEAAKTRLTTKGRDPLGTFFPGAEPTTTQFNGGKPDPGAGGSGVSVGGGASSVGGGAISVEGG